MIIFAYANISSQFILIFLPPIFSATEASGARGGLFGAGGRFKGGTDPIMEKFNESLSFDKR